MRKIILIAALTIGSVFSQDTYMRHLQVEDGLPSGVVYHAMQDKDNWMWFSTDQGVCKYNGFGIVNYMVSDGVSDNEVFTCFQDSKGRIWMATANGQPTCFFDGVFYTYESITGKPFEKKSFLTGINEDINNDIWFSWRSGETIRFSFEEKVIEQLNRKSFRDEGARFILFSHEGYLVNCPF